MDVYSYAQTPCGFPAGMAPARPCDWTVPRANDTLASGTTAWRERASLPRNRYRSVAGSEPRPHRERHWRPPRSRRPSARARPLGSLSPAGSSLPRGAGPRQAYPAWHMACIPSGDRSGGDRPRESSVCPLCTPGPRPIHGLSPRAARRPDVPSWDVRRNGWPCGGRLPRLRPGPQLRAVGQRLHRPPCSCKRARRFTVFQCAASPVPGTRATRSGRRTRLPGRRFRHHAKGTGPTEPGPLVLKPNRSNVPALQPLPARSIPAL